MNFNVPVPKKQLVQKVPIMFTDKDEEPVVYLHEDALVVKVTLCNMKF